mmetsp:Transcript_6960/g.7433  ORF Transcript_6960/g.7433 Transcript_6960/m.7433 type:complete len:93 (+) Transcript_6960:753-1031(+)
MVCQQVSFYSSINMHVHILYCLICAPNLTGKHRDRIPESRDNNSGRHPVLDLDCINHIHVRSNRWPPFLLSTREEESVSSHDLLERERTSNR